MHKLSSTLTIVVTLLIWAVFPAGATENFVIKESKFSVSETIDRLEKVLTSNGLTIFKRVDHAAGAKKAGLELADNQVLIFGNPKLGTPLMQSNPMIGIDLPQKALAWKDKDGKVWLAYNAPAALKIRHAIEGKDEVLKKITGALGKFSDVATGAASGN